MSDLHTPMFSYKQYVNDQQKLKQTGTVDAGIQKQSPKSAGARGLQKTHEFTNTKVQMMGEVGDTLLRPGPTNPNPKVVFENWLKRRIPKKYHLKFTESFEKIFSKKKFIK